MQNKVTKATQNPLLKTTLASVVVFAMLTAAGCHGEEEHYYDSNVNDPKPTDPKNKTPMPPSFGPPTGIDNLDPSQLPLIKPAVLVNEFTTTQLMKELKIVNAGAHAISEEPKCDVVVKKYTYITQGVQGEDTTATSAIMMPKGDNLECQGERPIFLYAHGTTVDKAYDYSQVGYTGNPASSSSTAIAANFAAQGYIVVAPNFAGYDESDLDYHPYLNAKQQSKDMSDSLAAAKKVLEAESDFSASEKLFVAGYSEGGHVALATTRYLESIGQTVTATAPMSGPYSMVAFGDEIFKGKVNVGGTIFAPMVAVNYNKDYGNIYVNPSDIVNEKYAEGLETLIPGYTSPNGLFSSGRIPISALFEKNPEGFTALESISPPSPSFGYGFDDTNYLIKTEFRSAYVQDTIDNPDGYTLNDSKPLPPVNPQDNLRKALKINDLRTYVPKSPVMLCGGNQDPTVFFDVNQRGIQKVWQELSNEGENLNVITVDIDKTNQASRNVETVNYIGDAQQLQASLEPKISEVQNQFKSVFFEKLKNEGQFSIIRDYHGSLTSLACFKATSVYFNEFKD